MIRVQDNYVTQWGDPNADSGDSKPLPDGLKVMGESGYILDRNGPEATTLSVNMTTRLARAGEEVDEFLEEGEERPFEQVQAFTTAGIANGVAILDQYAGASFHAWGWTIGSSREGYWPVHCYGMVGVSRGMSPNTGDRSSLYTVIGHAPRHLDRNIVLVGRVIEGMEHLSSLPRGKGDLGFYAEDEIDKRTPIHSVRVAADPPSEEQPAFEFLSTESETFARYVEARANRRDPFFIVPAGGADICNIPVPVRRAE